MNVSVLVTDMPGPIAKRVDEEARERDLSVNSVIVEVLAARYGVAWEPPRYGYTGPGESDARTVRMPEQLRAAIRQHARSLVGGSQRGVILMALADHYGAPVQSPRRRYNAALTPEQVSEARSRHRAGASIRSLTREFNVHRLTMTKAVRA